VNPTVSMGGRDWNYKDASTVMQLGIMPDGSEATPEQARAAADAFNVMAKEGYKYGVPGALPPSSDYRWPTTPPVTPPPHQAMGAALAIQLSGITPVVAMGGLSEAQSYTSYLQRWDDVNLSNAPGRFGDFLEKYNHAMLVNNGEGGAAGFAMMPSLPTFLIGADFKTYHESWTRPLGGQASPDNPGGAEPPPAIVTAVAVGNFDFTAATQKKHLAEANQTVGASFTNLLEKRAAEATPPKVSIDPGSMAQMMAMFMAALGQQGWIIKPPATTAVKVAMDQSKQNTVGP
jgi:hypothetical protein